jgi:hypothetical protein
MTGLGFLEWCFLNIGVQQSQRVKYECNEFKMNVHGEIKIVGVDSLALSLSPPLPASFYESRYITHRNM